ncbi:HNH endonuclease signature motif containing protein [Aeromicrobium sp. 9AM]|uniref:HNH endonuclease signature motif containing protein n=1 Tax=Aeromicrobium sp. 9AM TaxID=2653126 RepID=UPI0012F19082
MTITSETRKRLWARSGNRCAICRKELIRDDVNELPGALVGEEAHIIARSPGGPRYEPLDEATRDGYANLILLCANDHTEVDAQPTRYTVELLRNLKNRHDLWVASRLGNEEISSDDDGTTLAVALLSGAEVWDLMGGAMAYQCGSPEDLADDEADLVDGALQDFKDWGEIAPSVIDNGFRAVRSAKRSIQDHLDNLAAAGFAALGGERQGIWAAGQVKGKIAVLEIVRVSDLESRAGPGPSPF